MRSVPLLWVPFVLAAAACGGSEAAVDADCDSSEHFDLHGSAMVETKSTDNPATCDPLITARLDPDLDSTGAPGIYFLLQYGLAGGTTHANFVQMRIYGETPGTYTIDVAPGADQAIVTLQTGSDTCTITAGTVELTAVGVVGETVEGNYTFTASSGAFCPAVLTGTFKGVLGAAP